MHYNKSMAVNGQSMGTVVFADIRPQC